jgi:hypothetical protein
MPHWEEFVSRSKLQQAGKLASSKQGTPGISFLACLLAARLLAVPASAQADLWSGILAPARATDWSTAGVTGGIASRSTVCATLNPGATVAQINSALAACPSGQVVLLNAGIYNLSGTLMMRNNVTLRGQGMSTILNFNSQGGSPFYWMGADIAIAFQGTGWSGAGDNAAPGAGGVPASTVRDWIGTNGQTGVYTQGARVLNLSAAPTGLTVGGTITLWQSDAPDNTLPTSGYFVSDKCCSGSGDISWKGTAESHDAGQAQRSLVVAISGSQVTIAAPGITRPAGAWAAVRSPKAGWQSGMLTGAGLEYLRVVRTGSHSGTIGINGTADSWILGVGITGTITAANGITVFDSRNITVKDCWMDRIFGGGGGQFTSYGITLVNTSHSLIENNVLNNVESPIMLNAGSTGNVLAYNYEVFNQGEGGIQLHEEGAAMNLFEGNSVLKFWFDTIHGNTQLNTAFRNHTFSADAGADIWTFNRWYSLIGNVLAAKTVYKTASTDTTRYTRWGGYCFRLGYGSQYEGPENHDPADVGTSNQPHDPLVGSSAMLWGNYCAAGASTRWLASDVPSADPVFPNPVPASQVLPPSFYYAAKPAWWPVSKPWPAIGPDVAGGNASGVGGHAYTLPAADCFTTSGGTIANFNPASCYVSGGGPPPSSSGCDLNNDSTTNVSDVQICVNQAIGTVVCGSGDINKDGSCNVVDVQRDVNAALGGICVTQ